MPKEKIFATLTSFNLKLEPDQYNKLRKSARERKQSMSSVLRELIEEHLKS